MAISEKTCVFEVRFFVPEVPALMHILVNAKTEGIVLIENHLRSFPGTHFPKEWAADDEREVPNDDPKEPPKFFDLDRAGTKFLSPQSVQHVLLGVV